MSSFIVAEIEKREAAWRESAVKASPTVAQKIGNVRAKAVELETQAAQLEAAAVDAATEIENLFQQRGELLHTVDFLARIAGDIADLEKIVNVALTELVQANATQDSFARTRWENGATNAARLSAIAPFLPAFIQKNADALQAVEREIRATAKTHGLDLRKLIEELQGNGQTVAPWTD